MVEFVGTMPLLVLGALLCIQALLLAFSLMVAQVSADRAARGLSVTRARASMPQPWRDRAVIERHGEQWQVRIAAPSVIPGASRVLVVRASSRVDAP